MTNSPDPLASNPSVRRWAEKFYDVMSWDMPDQSDPVEGLDESRLAAQTELNKIVIGSELMPGARRSFDGGRKAIQQAINSAKTVEAFTPIDKDILDLGNDIAAQLEIAAARVKSENHQDAAKQKFKAVSPVLDQGAYIFLETELAKAVAAHGKAVTKNNFDASAKLSVDYLGLCGDAETYGNYFNTWESASVGYIATAIKKADRDAVTTLRRTKMNAAEAAARTGDFATAKAKLEEWAASPDVGTADFAKAEAFTKAMLVYTSTQEETCKDVLASGIDSANTYSKHPKKIKNLAYSQKKYDDALVMLNELTTWAIPRQPLAKEMLRFDNAMRSEEAFRDGMKLMNDADGKDDIPGAIAALKKLQKNKSLMKVNYSSQILKKLAKRYAALMTLLQDPERTHLKTTWKTHKKHVNNEEWDDAYALVPVLDDLFHLEKMVDQRAELAGIFLSNTDASTFGYQADLTAAMAVPKYKDALAALKVCLPLIRNLPEYLHARGDMLALKGALPGSGTPLHDALDKAMVDAKVLADGKDPDGATKHLRDVMEGADYLSLAMEMADYRLKSAEIAKRHAKARKLLGITEAQTAIDLSLTEAEALATGGKFAQSYLALQKHGGLLDQAQGLGAAHRQATGIMSGLRRAVTTTPDLFDGESPTVDELDVALQAAVLLAKDKDFAGAKTAFDKVLTDAAALNTIAATKYEALDGAGSNAGHSIQRHGPGLTDEQLILRLKTGTPPNPATPDEKSPTGASSSFDSAADWLAGRELAAKHAESKGIDLTATEITPPYDAKLSSSEIIIEHGRAIDRAFVGVKKEKKFDPGTQSFIDKKTYETYEEMSGLTRAYVNFLWEFPVITDCPKVDKFDNPVLDDLGAPVLADHNAQDVLDYVDAWKRKHGVEPPDIPGRWVMMQQYPVADGWDDTLKAYTTEPKGMIP